MAQANSVVDVILAEAGGRSLLERYTDMLNIASVIQNRSNFGGVSPDDVVSVRTEFNAYGGRMPPGVEAYRPLAESVWQQVQAAQISAREAAAEEQRKREITEAKRAGFSVTGSGADTGSPQGASLRDELSRQFDRYAA